MPPSTSCSFRERCLITMTNHRSRIPMILEQPGKISRSKAFGKTLSCMEWKASITNARCKGATNPRRISNLKPWLLSASRGAEGITP